MRERSASGGTGSERGARAVLTYPPDERSRATGDEADEFKLSSLNQDTENSLFTGWNVFLLYCCFFGYQGRRHNTLFHTVFDVVLVQLNEWIPVLLKCR